MLVFTLSYFSIKAQNQNGHDIDGENANDLSGHQLSMTNNWTVAIGALYNRGNGANAGHVRVFQELYDSVGLNIYTSTEQQIFHIYPNPAQDKIELTSPKGQFKKFRIYNFNGTLINEGELEASGRSAISLEKIKPGLYLISIIGSGFEIATKLLVK